MSIEDDVHAAGLMIDQPWAHSALTISSGGQVRHEQTLWSTELPGGGITLVDEGEFLSLEINDPLIDYHQLVDYRIAQVGLQIPSLEGEPPWPHLVHERAAGLLIWQLRYRVIRYRDCPLSLVWRWRPRAARSVGATVTIEGLELDHTNADVVNTHGGMLVLAMADRIVAAMAGRP